VTLPPAVRACAAVAGSVVTFAWLVERAGLLPAVVATVLVASMGAAQRRFRRALTLAVCLAAGLWLLFVVFLEQPFSAIRGF
jgi:putative tricarboxylic transport membrane protein